MLAADHKSSRQEQGYNDPLHIFSLIGKNENDASVWIYALLKLMQRKVKTM
jgi:DhnA family fructose-bisphosphate aldolase class Ia